MTWRDSPPLPSWREFLRAAWNAMIRVDETAKTVEKIEGHLVVVNEHAERFARALKVAQKGADSFRATQFRTTGGSPMLGQLRVVEETSNFMQVLPIQVLWQGGANLSTDPISPIEAGAFDVALQGLPSCVHIVEMRIGQTTVFKGEARSLRIEQHPSPEPAIVSVWIVHRPIPEEVTS